MKFWNSVMNMSNIKRFGTSHMVQPYNVAEHSFRVVMLSMLIVDEYNAKNPSKKINSEEVIRKAILHDFEENVTNDIISPIKAMGLKTILREISEKVMDNEVLDDSLANKAEYMRLWKEDKTGESGEIIEIADKMEAFFAACNELYKGNREMTGAYMNIKGWFATPEAQTLMRKYPVTQQLVLEAITKVEGSEASSRAFIK